MAAATAFATADLLGLPRPESSSDAATQAPSASFQIDLYDLFILLTKSVLPCSLENANFGKEAIEIANEYSNSRQQVSDNFEMRFYRQ
ncbi:hypothetical protein WJ542_26330 [Paraburkholderia sp. B3]|uniref:hypothetical protein n=1 Tax=Paraburkholderia sp. B3 TaxID=3134791 RepID=UPI0039829B59